MQMIRILSLAVTVIAYIPPPSFADGPSILGTYQLESRDLAGGVTLKPPAIIGMATYTTSYRNVNVSWVNSGGERVSFAYIARYRLTPTEYQETPIYWMSNNLGEKGVSYSAPAGRSAVNKVSAKDGVVTITLSGELPELVFTSSGMTATARDTQGKMIFMDHWKKVE